MSLLQRTANLFRRKGTASHAVLPSQSPTNGVLVDLRDVVKNYQTPAGEFPALRGINLQVKAGEFTAVIGKSGSGKSTLINMITGIDRPTLGEVIVNGTPIHTLNEDQMAVWRSRNLGVVFQFFQMLPTLTLIENVQLPMLISKLYPRSEHPERAMHLLDMVGLASQASKFPSEVSGGQQQRAAIARSLANDPKILVADEPTGSLDSKTGDAIFRIFEDFVSQGRTILMVTHDRSLASRVSRVVFIADGEVVDELVSDALPSLSPRHQVQVLSQLETERYEPGAEIIRQGDLADTFYIITRGEAEVVMKHPSGEELILDHLKTGQYFGEIGILEKRPRTATVRATADSDVTVMQLSREVFARVMEECNLTRDEMAHVIRQRAIEADLHRALPDLTKDLVADLLDGVEIKRYGPGEVIIRQGDTADAFYILTEGYLDVTMKSSQGAEQVIDRLGPGQFFGEMAILENSVRTATVRADPHMDVAILELNADTFVKMQDGSHLTAQQIAELMRQRLVREYVSHALPPLSTELLMNLPLELDVVHYPAEAFIIKQGDQPDIFYIIGQGEVDVLEDRPHGPGVLVERLHAGQFFGEVGLLNNTRHPIAYRVSPDRDAELVPMSKVIFETLMDQSKDTLDMVTQLMQQRLEHHRPGGIYELIDRHSASKNNT